MKVLLLSCYSRLGSASRVRFYQYLPYLEAHGIQVTVAPLLEDSYIEELYADRRRRLGAIFCAYLRRLGYLIKSRGFDLLWIEKEVVPWFPPWAEAILARLNIPYVVDYDDPTFHRYDMHPRAIVRRLLEGKIDSVMRWASLVIVGNDYLADRARLAGAKRVEYLPSVIDLDRYRIEPRNTNSVFTIGWIGAPVTAKYLHLVEPALSELWRDGKQRLVLVGSGQVELDGLPVEVRAWSEETEVADIQSFDVGIMPMPDEPWTRGKCGYKLIQYMACGRPVVASPVGVNREIIDDGVNGFLAKTSADWVHALFTLRDNRDLGERMGRAGRLNAETQYCLQVTAPRLLSLLNSGSRGFK